MSKNKVKIKCAAIVRSDGVVVEGRSHADCIVDSPLGTCKEGSIQGFVTDEGKFVDRRRAGRIAFVAGQIPKRVSVLFSEDLTGDWPWKKK